MAFQFPPRSDSHAELRLRGDVAASFHFTTRDGKYLLVPPAGPPLRLLLTGGETRLDRLNLDATHFGGIDSREYVSGIAVDLRFACDRPPGLTDLPSAEARDLALAVLRGEPRAAELARRVIDRDSGSVRLRSLLTAWLLAARLTRPGWAGRLEAATLAALPDGVPWDAAAAVDGVLAGLGLLDDPAKGDACEDAGCEGR